MVIVWVCEHVKPQQLTNRMVLPQFPMSINFDFVYFGNSESC